MSQYNLANNHPIIPNANQYFLEKKYITICSEDRDILKYPNSSEFEIELPQDYLNVASAKLFSWSFPSNYNVFSVSNNNITMSFKFITLYNPGEYSFSDVLSEGIFAALYNDLNYEYIINIEPGFYNPEQMATELTNKFNEQVTTVILDFFASPEGAPYSAAATLFTSYNRFRIVYNSVQQSLWFGNTCDKFVLTNNSNIYKSSSNQQTTFDNCVLNKNTLPETSNWGLPYNLGFTRCSSVSQNVIEIQSVNTQYNQYELETSIDSNNGLPRFFYGNINVIGDNGYWLQNATLLPGSTPYFLKSPNKINFMGPSYIYMEIAGLNCIDETSPYNISKFTLSTNETNGIANSCFAQIPVPTTPISEWFDNNFTGPYKYFNPAAERIRRLKIKLRYHNGQLVNFGSFPYNFMLEFSLLRPQQERSYNIKNAIDLDQYQTFGNK
jgi:hypothetical protein